MFSITIRKTPSITTAIKRRKWDLVLDLLQSESDLEQLHGLLSLCLEFSAPVLVVQMMIEQYDDDECTAESTDNSEEEPNSIQNALSSLDTTYATRSPTVTTYSENVKKPRKRHFTGLICMPDINNRYPLHHAAIHSVDEETIQYLYRSYPAAATKLDVSGRTPLMLASFSCMCSKPSTVSKALQCVESLIVCCPKALIVEDDEGLTAIESFLYSNNGEHNRRKGSNKMVMNLLQGYTAKYLMQRREKQRKKDLGITIRKKCPKVEA